MKNTEFPEKSISSCVCLHTGWSCRRNLYNSKCERRSSLISSWFSKGYQPSCNILFKSSKKLLRTEFCTELWLQVREDGSSNQQSEDETRMLLLSNGFRCLFTTTMSFWKDKNNVVQTWINISGAVQTDRRLNCDSAKLKNVIKILFRQD